MLVALACALAWIDRSGLSPREGGLAAGDAVWARAFLVLLALGFVAYVAGLRLLRHGARTGAVVALALAVQLMPLAAPLLLSTDAWTYWAYGWIAHAHDANPYRETPDAFPDDPSTERAGAAWRDSPSVYGPAFTLSSELVAAGTGRSAAAAAWAYKALAALAVCAVVLLAARLGARPAFAAAFVGWNPVLAVHLAGGGHNDAWVGALVLAALAFGSSGRRQWAGVSWAAAIGVKWIPLVLLPLRALEARTSGRRVGHAGLAAGIVVLAALATWRYGTAWLGAFGPLARNALETTSYALPHRLSQLGVPEPAAIALFALLFVGCYAVLVRQALAGRARLALCAGLLVACSPYVAPWYLAWVVPLAAVEEDRSARVLALALSAYLLPQTIPI